MLRYKGGTSVASKHTSSKRKEHTNAQRKETCAGKGHSGKIPPWVKVSGRRGKSATRLAYKACFKGSVESNMEPTLGQRCRDANVIKQDTMRPLQCNFTSPEKVSSVVFSCLESLKKCKRRLQGVPFLEIV
jgi:hypothetical protein